jgi:putative N6-adenine-specific DNA methylase
VARELKALGEQPRIEDGGVSWDGDARSMMRANLWLRTASRVLVRVARFKATAFYELEKRAKQIPWDRFVGPGREVEFRVTARKSKLYHSDAIAERLLSARGLRLAADGTKLRAASREPRAASQLFVVRVVHDEFTISADTSGELLHMRGYRQAIGKAPLRETLASALLLAGDWTGESSLLDPFCGSGPIPIEGALIARRIPPGLHRPFGFMQWPNYRASHWKELVAEAQAGVRASSPVPILGSDRDAGAIESAQANAERAGVASDIELSVRAISAIEPPDTPGLIATNPPYGVRVGKAATVRDLYAQLGHVLRQRCSGWRIAMYCPDIRLVGEVGLSFQELLRTSNGGIKVTALLAYVPSSAVSP